MADTTLVVDEAAIAGINAAIANCPLINRYAEPGAQAVDDGSRMQLVPTLTIKAVITKGAK